jgi:hypothetical protein
VSEVEPSCLPAVLPGVARSAKTGAASPALSLSKGKELGYPEQGRRVEGRPPSKTRGRRIFAAIFKRLGGRSGAHRAIRQPADRMGRIGPRMPTCLQDGRFLLPDRKRGVIIARNVSTLWARVLTKPGFLWPKTLEQRRLET